VARRAGSIAQRIARIPFPLRGPRVDLVPAALEQVPELVRLLNDPTISRWTSHVAYPYTRAHARTWLLRARRERRQGSALYLSIIRRSDRALVGGVGLHQVHEAAACAEIGYWLGRPFRGEGIATEAVDLLTRVGLRRLRLHRIEALVFPPNRASREVLRRCGFRYEGRIRDEIRKGRRWYTTLLFARLSTDPPPRRRSSAAVRRTQLRRRR